jgi:D-alanyl-D-alanine dipeptidase
MKKLVSLLEISSSEFRTKIKELGFTEKGNELTSGGDLKSDLLDIVSSLVAEWKKSNPNCPLNFTSGNDSFHKGITTYVSRHTKGEALDVTLPSSCHSLFITLLNTYKSKYNGFSYIDEYTNPTAKATGGHFHMSYRSGAPEGGGKSGGGDTSTPANNTSTSNSATQTSKYSYQSSDVSKPNDEFTTSAENMNKGFITQATNALGLTKVESISGKEKKLLENIQKIKKLL